MGTAETSTLGSSKSSQKVSNDPWWVTRIFTGVKLFMTRSLLNRVKSGVILRCWWGGWKNKKRPKYYIWHLKSLRHSTRYIRYTTHVPAQGIHDTHASSVGYMTHMSAQEDTWHTCQLNGKHDTRVSSKGFTTHVPAQWDSWRMCQLNGIYDTHVSSTGKTTYMLELSTMGYMTHMSVLRDKQYTC